MLAVRLELPVLALKAKLTTPLVMPVMVSHAWSLVGANGASRLAVAGSTTGNTSLPAAGTFPFGLSGPRRHEAIL